VCSFIISNKINRRAFLPLLSISNILDVNSSLSTGFIILGAVSLMMGMFASVVFRRQAFAEKDLRHYLDNSLIFKAERER